jgi:hypothetical protein
VRERPPGTAARAPLKLHDGHSIRAPRRPQRCAPPGVCGCTYGIMGMQVGGRRLASAARRRRSESKGEEPAAVRRSALPGGVAGGRSVPPDPKRDELGMASRKGAPRLLDGRTGDCCNSLGGAVPRGERLIKLRYSWLSAKAIQVARCRDRRRSPRRAGRVPLDGEGFPPIKVR